jgi:hypothetical protein
MPSRCKTTFYKKLKLGPHNINRCQPHDFTQQIRSIVRRGTSFANMPNHNEKLAKKEGRDGCTCCRYWDDCSLYIGRYHKPCSEFEWD